MADENVQTAETVVANAQPDHSAELAQQMNLSLGLGNAGNQNVEGSTEQQQSQSTQTTDVKPDAVAQVTPNDPFGFIKEKFGYEDHEAAIRDIEDLRAFKANPTTPQFNVPDEESAAMLRALAAGKREEVYKLLHHDMQIDRLVSGDLNKDNAAEIVKMGMQLKYKNLTPEQINYKFNKDFAIPPQPQKGYEEDDEVYNQRLGDWQRVAADKEMELMIEATIAKPELQNAKGKFTLPEIESPIDEGYAQYQQMLAQKAQDDVVTRQAYQALTPKQIETKLNFKDEANKIEFEYQFEPDKEGFVKAVQTASDADLFWQTFTNPDGTPNRQKFLDMIYYANNKEKVIMSAINQGKNAAIKASLPDNSQGGLLTHQQTQSQEPNELDQQMRLSLRGHGGF